MHPYHYVHYVQNHAIHLLICAGNTPPIPPTITIITFQGMSPFMTTFNNPCIVMSSFMCTHLFPSKPSWPEVLCKLSCYICCHELPPTFQTPQSHQTVLVHAQPCPSQTLVSTWNMQIFILHFLAWVHVQCFTVYSSKCQNVKIIYYHFESVYASRLFIK